MNSILKKTVSMLLLFVMLSLMVPADCVKATSNDSPYVKHVYGTFGESDKLDLLYQLMELETGVMDPVYLDVEMDHQESGLTYRVFQYDDSAKKRYDIITSDQASFAFYADDLRKDIPLYLAVFKGRDLLTTRLLVVRVSQGRSENFVVSEIASEYEDSIKVGMDELLPGMKFEMHPYIIPISCKAFTDGRVVIGMGINSSNVSFWKNARNGTLSQSADVKELSDAFWGNSENRSAVKGKDMGLVVNFSGWVQGNIYSNEPMTGQLSLYVGSGFAISGQYAILTWDVIVTAGAASVLEFSLLYNEEKSKYDEFVVDSFSMQFSAGLELYGGIGLSSIASFGVYGAGSITLKDQFYPDPVVQSLVLAGEAGFKVKAFSRTLFSYAIVSGSKEFVKDEDKKKAESGTALVNVSDLNSIGSKLLGVNYADVAAAISEPEGNGTWYTGMTPSGTLAGYETDPDFDRIIAEDVYSDNHLKAVKTVTGSEPQINVVFLGSDSSRSNGNRSRLMNFYYREKTNFISEPEWITDDSLDDGTADYEPDVFHSDYGGRTYLVWQNALTDVSSDDTFREIAGNTDLFFAEFDKDGSWKNVSRVTAFADDSSSRVFAAGAKIWEDWDYEPLITYYTNDVSDPIGADTSATHDIYIAQMQDGSWVNEKVFSVNGQVTDVGCAYFHKSHTVAVCYNTDSPDTESGRKYTMELWQKTDGAWTKIFSRTGENGATLSSCKYIKTFKNQNILTWYERDRVYYMLNETFNAQSLVSSENTVPTPDYEIYGKLVDGPIAIVGTYSRESSENAFAIYSGSGGVMGAKLDLTDIAENASVNAIAVAITEDKQPIVFYSVHNYKLNSSLDMSYVNADAETLLTSPLRGSFEGLGSGLLLGQDDPRFIDTHTDLYVKARHANQRIKILDVRFDDVTGARKGSSTPATVQIENNGMYNVDGITVYLNGQKLSDHDLFIRSGETKSFSISVPVPADAADAPLDFEIGVSSREDIIDSTYTATLSPGEIFVKYNGELLYGTEEIGYSVTAAGFAKRYVTVYVFDEDSGEMIYSYPTSVAAGRTINSQTSRINGLFADDGHTHLKAYVLDEEESKQVKDGMTLAQVEELLNLPSSRAFLYKTLDKIYVQDFSGAFKTTSSQSSGDSGDVPAQDPDTEQPDDGSGEESGSGDEEPSGEPSVPDTPDVPEPGVVPGNQPGTDPDPDKGSGWLIPAAAGAGILALVLLIFFLLKRRKKDEEQ